MSKLEVIVDVHQLKKQGFNVSAIARKCNLSRTTVYEYLEMDYEEACRWVDVLKTRKRKLAPYQDKILNWLKEHPDLTASQISDWLEGHCEFNTVGESTVRTYVKKLGKSTISPNHCRSGGTKLSRNYRKGNRYKSISER